MNVVESKLISEIEIRNTVTTADLKQEIDIASFNEYEHLSSNLDLYHCGYVKDELMKGRVTVFKSGKLISVGTRSPENSKKELRKASRILQKYKLSKPIKIIATFHPAALLRNPNWKKDCWQDLQIVIKELGLTPTAKIEK